MSSTLDDNRDDSRDDNGPEVRRIGLLPDLTGIERLARDALRFEAWCALVPGRLRAVIAPDEAPQTPGSVAASVVGLVVGDGMPIYTPEGISEATDRPDLNATAAPPMKDYVTPEAVMEVLAGITARLDHVSGPVASSYRSVWLDPHTPAPDGWTWCRTLEEAISVAKVRDIAYLSMDADLAIGADNSLLSWMTEQLRWVTTGMRIHSGRPENVARLLLETDQHGPFPFTPICGPHTRGESPGYGTASGWPEMASVEMATAEPGPHAA